MPFERFKDKHGGMGPLQALYAGQTGGEGLFGQWRPRFARERMAETLDAISGDAELPDDFKAEVAGARDANLTMPETFAAISAIEQRARDIKTVNGAFRGFSAQQGRLRQAAMSNEDRAQLDVLDTQAEYGRSLMLSSNPELQAMGRAVTEKVFAGQQSFATTNEAQTIAAEATLGSERWTKYSALQDNYRQESAPFLEQRAAFARIKASLATPDSPAGDQALVFNFMKMLDPGSAVLPGEYATATNLAGVPDAVLTLYNRMLRDGQRLTPEQRKDFFEQATAQLTAAQGQQTERDTRYIGQARDVGLPEKMLGHFQMPRADAGGDPESFGTPQDGTQPLGAGAPDARPSGAQESFESNWPRVDGFLKRVIGQIPRRAQRETDEYEAPAAPAMVEAPVTRRTQQLPRRMPHVLRHRRTEP